MLYSLLVNFQRITIIKGTILLSAWGRKKKRGCRNANRRLAPYWQNRNKENHQSLLSTKSNLLPCKYTQVEVLRLFAHGRKLIATPSLSANFKNLQIFYKELGNIFLYDNIERSAVSQFQENTLMPTFLEVQKSLMCQCCGILLLFIWFCEVLLHSTFPSFLLFILPTAPAEFQVFKKEWVKAGGDMKSLSLSRPSHFQCKTYKQTERQTATHTQISLNKWVSQLDSSTICSGETKL